MSIPVYEWICTECDWKRMDYQVFKLRQYRDQEKCAAVLQAPGWCRHCNNLNAVEWIPGAAELNDLYQELSSLEVADVDRVPGWQFWRRAPELSEDRRRQLNNVRSLLDRARAVADLLRARQSPARCLECGGIGVEVLGDWQRRREPMDCAHPGCRKNGMLQVRSGNWRISIEEEVATYSIEGLRI